MIPALSTRAPPSRSPAASVAAIHGLDSRVLDARPGDEDGQAKVLQPLQPFDVARRHPRGIPLPQRASWPQPWPLALGSDAVALPVPAQNIFEIKENPRATAQSLLPFSRHAEQTAATVRPTQIATNVRSTIRGKPHFGVIRRPGASKVAGRATRNAAGPRRGPLRHLVQVKKRNV